MAVSSSCRILANSLTTVKTSTNWLGFSMHDAPSYIFSESTNFFLALIVCHKSKIRVIFTDSRKNRDGPNIAENHKKSSEK